MKPVLLSFLLLVACIQQSFALTINKDQLAHLHYLIDQISKDYDTASQFSQDSSGDVRASCFSGLASGIKSVRNDLKLSESSLADGARLSEAASTTESTPEIIGGVEGNRLVLGIQLPSNVERIDGLLKDEQKRRDMCDSKVLDGLTTVDTMRLSEAKLLLLKFISDIKS